MQDRVGRSLASLHSPRYSPRYDRGIDGHNLLRVVEHVKRSLARTEKMYQATIFGCLIVNFATTAITH
jgi:hypothetical protein